MASYLSHLECTICGAEYSANRLSGVSPCCGKVLYARYDLDRIRAEVDRDRLWSNALQTCGGFSRTSCPWTTRTTLSASAREVRRSSRC